MNVEYLLGRWWRYADPRLSCNRRRHVGLLAFFSLSLLVSMSLSQMANFEQGSLQYWLLVGMAAFIPALNIEGVVQALLGPARWLLAFLVLAGTWHLARGDAKALLQLGLLVFVLAWLTVPSVTFKVRDVELLYVLMVAIGVAIAVLTDFTPYGLVPGRTIEDFGALRVSFFPNVAYTGIFSLGLVMLLTRDRAHAMRRPWLLALATYFLVFSLVRTALIGLVVYALLRWWFDRKPTVTSGQLFWSALATAVVVNLVIAVSPVVIQQAQQLPLVSQIFLQGKSDLGAEEIMAQMYRPWLWLQQVGLFLSSPYLMGWGSFDFFEMVVLPFDDRSISAGTESLPTRLLSSYGWPTLLFIGFLIGQLRRSAKNCDRWAVACFPVVLLLLMQWGSVFHPSDSMFLLFMLMLAKGSRGYAWQ